MDWSGFLEAFLNKSMGVADGNVQGYAVHEACHMSRPSEPWDIYIGIVGAGEHLESIWAVGNSRNRCGIKRIRVTLEKP